MRDGQRKPTKMTRRPSLSLEVASDLKRQINGKAFVPGGRIPSEAELCAAYEVSRTVVREAIVRLRSEGLLVSRQGLGVFVSENAAQARFEVDWDQVRTLPQSIALLELRLAVEVESAGLCAQRQTKADAREIRKWMNKTNQQFRDPETSGVHYDFDFHLAIAKATKNPYFYQLLAFLQPIIVPRVKLSALMKGETKEAYYQLIQAEHEAVVSAIERRDETGARNAMRLHLMNSLKRLHNLAASYGVDRLDESGKTNAELMKEFIDGIGSGARG